MRVSGADSRAFLQGLITNDIERLSDGLLYAALLTPQGKFLFDFFLLSAAEDEIFLDVNADAAPALLQRLKLYRLRAKVELSKMDIKVACGLVNQPSGALTDPRHPALGWRHYGKSVVPPIDEIEWIHRRITKCIPESGIELIPEKTFILEMGFERLNGVDFHKGCFVGQEVTARMKHKTKLRKQLKQVVVEGHAPVGTDIVENGRRIGTLFSQARGLGLAHLRIDRIRDGELSAGDAVIRLIKDQ